MLAGAIMDAVLGGVFGGTSMGSMAMNDRFTFVSNVVALVAVLGIAVAARIGTRRAPEPGLPS